MSTLYVDTINEKTTGNGIYMPGHILQVVQATSGTAFVSQVENTWHDLAPTVTITPKSTSSKILISHSAAIMMNDSVQDLFFRILRGSTEIIQLGRYYSITTSANWNTFSLDFEYLDSPSTTSATTYKIQLQFSGTGNIRHNDNTGSFTGKAITMAKEVGG